MSDLQSPPPASGLSRRRFLAAAGLVGAGVVGGQAIAFLASTAGAASPSAPAPSGLAIAAASPAATLPPDAAASAGAGASPSAAPSLAAGQGRWHYRSRPDLTPPIVETSVDAASATPGFVFFTPGNGQGTDGPMIVDATGEPVWFRPGTGKAAANFAVNTWQGRPVLTWWEGTLNGGNGDGEYVMADASYRELMRIRARNGYRGDLHELQITPSGTALFLAGNWNAGTSAAGRTNLPWQIMDNVVQELDLRTGQVVFEWHSAAEIDPDESVVAPPTQADQIYDYVHANSIDIDRDGNLLVSARNTSAVYKIDRTTGRIRWRLGGKRSDFILGNGASFGYQHDARRRADGTITLFDDEHAPTMSRAIALNVDETAMTATLARAYARPAALQATSQGNMQVLPNGHAFVGWGSQPYFTEFAPDGTILFDATFAAGGQSYRSFRSTWSGQPAEPPAAALEPAGAGVTVYASWNGATDVAAWQVLGGPDAGRLRVIANAPRLGFETAVTLHERPAVVVVHALDASSKVLGTSAPVRAV